MKTTDIAKIRQLLKQAKEVRRSGMIFNNKSTISAGLNEICGLVEEALALLPCPTCNDSGRVPTFDQASGLADADPCPDCQS